MSSTSEYMSMRDFYAWRHNINEEINKTTQALSHFAGPWMISVVFLVELTFTFLWWIPLSSFCRTTFLNSLFSFSSLSSMRWYFNYEGEVGHMKDKKKETGGLHNNTIFHGKKLNLAF